MTEDLYSKNDEKWAFQIAQSNEPIATIYPDGLVVIHKDGGEKAAAEIFWNAFRDKIKQQWKERDRLKGD